MEIQFPIDDRLYYILYDLTKDNSLAPIHLPGPDDTELVLLKIDMDDYVQLRGDLYELCVDEGNYWMTSLIFRPPGAPNNETDLEHGVPYIIIAHVAMIEKDPEAFMAKLPKIRQLVFH